jgi:amidohydrolase
MNADEMKWHVQRQVDARKEELTGLSTKIHQNPETGWKEEKAAVLLADYLETNGFSVERGIYDLKTAFKATLGAGRPEIAFLTEYDALPTVGHGCGHNIIAAAAMGAAVAAKAVAGETGARISVFGCPAEELLGGKVILVEKGAFKEVDAALQVHPLGIKENWAGFQSTACLFLDVEFFGKETHAAANPWDGASALEAMIQSFNHVNALRLHVKDRGRISGIITRGGEAVNVIPGHAAGTFQMRSPDDGYLDQLKEKVLKCFEAAALATGCRLEYRWGLRCNAMINNQTLLGPWRKNMSAIGREVGEIVENSGSTDTGNVSVTVPTLHAFVSISAGNLPLHSDEFCRAAGSEGGIRAAMDGAKAMAMTAVDLITQPEILKRAKEELDRARSAVSDQLKAVSQD